MSVRRPRGRPLGNTLPLAAFALNVASKYETSDDTAARSVLELTGQRATLGAVERLTRSMRKLKRFPSRRRGGLKFGYAMAASEASLADHLVWQILEKAVLPKSVVGKSR